VDFAESYRRSADQCLRAVLVSVGDLDTAQDLVDEAFARAWASWRTVSKHPAPVAWVVRTALNANISRWRRRRREVSVPEATLLSVGLAGTRPELVPAADEPTVGRVRTGGHAVVVGGGIGGLAAAAGLHRADWDVIVVERARVLAEAGAGVGLWPNAVRALRVIGPELVPDLRERWALRGAAGVRSAGGRWLARMDPSWIEERYGEPVLVLPRAEVHTRLAGLVPAGAIRLGCTAGTARPAGSRAVVSGRGPAGDFEIETDLVVAADGVRSTMRALVDPRAVARYAGHTAWRALVPPSLAPPVADSVDAWGQGRRFGYAPIGDGGVYWFASSLAAPGGGIGAAELGMLGERFAGWHEPIPALLAATRPAALLRNDVWRLHPPARRLAAGRIALLGDAGHAMTPDLGQGACQALEDAAELILLAAQATPAQIPAALDRYDALRRARTSMVMRRSQAIARLAHLRGPLRCTMRDHLVPAAGPLIQTGALDDLLGWHPSGNR